MGIVSAFDWFPNYSYMWPFGDPNWTASPQPVPARGPGDGPLIIDVGAGYAFLELFYKDSFLDFGSWHSRAEPLVPGTTDIIGSNYNDIIYGSAEVNNLKGVAGNDVIQGRGGSDTLDGGGLGLTGPDSDTLDYSWSPGGVTAFFSLTNVSNAGTVDHSSGRDDFTDFEAFIGSPFGDHIDARNSWGRLEIDGGGGNDTILDSFKSHTLRGGGGNDTIIGGQGQDVIRGGDGDDTFEYAFSTDIDLVVPGEVIDGEGGTDTILVGGTAVNFALASISSIEIVNFNEGHYTTQTNRAPFIARQTSATATSAADSPRRCMS